MEGRHPSGLGSIPCWHSLNLLYFCLCYYKQKYNISTEYYRPQRYHTRTAFCSLVARCSVVFAAGSVTACSGSIPRCSLWPRILFPA